MEPFFREDPEGRLKDPLTRGKLGRSLVVISGFNFEHRPFQKLVIEQLSRDIPINGHFLKDRDESGEGAIGRDHFLFEGIAHFQKTPDQFIQNYLPGLPGVEVVAQQHSEALGSRFPLNQSFHQILLPMPFVFSGHPLSRLRS